MQLDEKGRSYIEEHSPKFIIVEQGQKQDYPEWLEDIAAVGYEPISITEHHRLVALCKRSK